jgi:hypothetical protein
MRWLITGHHQVCQHNLLPQRSLITSHAVDAQKFAEQGAYRLAAPVPTQRVHATLFSMPGMPAQLALQPHHVITGQIARTVQQSTKLTLRSSQ